MLSLSSTLIIDLLLLSDAAAAKDHREIRRLARRVEKCAGARRLTAIATHARFVELLAQEGAEHPVLTGAVDRLLCESEREIHTAGFKGDEFDTN
jgi:hypothetical protein